LPFWNNAAAALNDSFRIPAVKVKLARRPAKYITPHNFLLSVKHGPRHRHVQQTGHWHNDGESRHGHFGWDFVPFLG
jgi:hypothetical protein